MKYRQADPIKFPEANKVFNAPAGMDNCEPLHTLQTDTEIWSVWKVRSFWARMLFMIDGRITLTVWGRGIPPMAVGIGNAFRKAESK